jgi:hypothetical protein
VSEPRTKFGRHSHFWAAVCPKTFPPKHVPDLHLSLEFNNLKFRGSFP